MCQIELLNHLTMNKKNKVKVATVVSRTNDEHSTHLANESGQEKLILLDFIINWKPKLG